MTKNRSMRIAILVLALALLTSCFVGSTFAKFTSTSNGTGSVTVARWSVSVDGKDVVTGTPVEFDLLGTVMDDDELTAETGTADGVFAPGTSGSFNIVLSNASDVWAKVDVDFALADGVTLPQGLKFSVDGGEATSLEDLVISKNIAFANGDTPTTATVTVNWVWDFYVSADQDTNDLSFAGKTIDVTATMTAVQLDQQP